ncbi:MAG: sulfur carrier protein ThiS [Clostridia bacterium]|nr:sulfur carrier protein ThiS [Clostridia bacterium]
MQVTVNGEIMSFPSNISLLQLLENLGLNPGSVAVELNGVIVDRDSYEKTGLGNGDVVEIVRFVGGG